MLNPSRAGSTFDVERVRADFPILHRTVHDGKPLVYLDNAATSQKPRVVIEALTDYYETCNANVHRALHYLGETATARFEAAREKLRAFIQAPAVEQVIFTRGTTESVNLVAYAWGRSWVSEGDVVWATGMEHHSNLVPWQILCRERGATLKLIPVEPDGTLDLSVCDTWADEPVKLVAVTHMSNVLGTVNPVRDMARRAHAVGARCLIDAAQSVPHQPVDVQALEADFVVFSGHKMCGPTGVGALYARAEALAEMTPFMGGGEMIQRVNDTESTWAEWPYKFEAGTPNIADVIALGAAVDYLQQIGMDAVHAYEQALTAYTIERLEQIEGLRVFGKAPERGGAVSFALADLHPHDVSQYVDQHGVAIRAGHLCAQPLMRRLGVSAVARASVYFYNTPAEIDLLVAALEKAQRFFRHG